MSVPKYDVIIVGAGIAGPAMAYALSSSSNLRKSIPESSQRRRPLRILLMDSKLRKPDRIVGELLQPGGVNALRKIGLEHALEDIGAIRAKGYCVMRPKPHPSSSSLKDDGGSGTQFEQVHIPYPGGHEGRSFHHGEFVSSLRTCAASAPGVTLMERSVSSDLVCCPHTGRILGVRATRTQGGKEEVFLAKLTIFANGMSSFRKAVYQPFPSTSSASTSKPAADIHNNNMETKSLGSFHGLVLPHPPKKQYILPMYQHGTVILVPGAAGPILLYQISTHETRMLIDIPKNSPHAKAIPSYIKSVILPNLPTPELRQSLQTLVSEAEEKGEKLKTKSATNPFFPAPPQGGHRTREGGLLLGDAWNQRHPLTGGGMTVAFWDVVTLASELIAAERVLFGDDTQGNGVSSSHNGSIGTSHPDGAAQAHEEEWSMGRWDLMEGIFDRWWWRRKGYASTINILSVALYDLFGGSSSDLETLQTGCFKYFELGGEAINGPVSLLAGLAPRPFLLFCHFFAVAFYSLWVMFTHRRPVVEAAKHVENDDTELNGYANGHANGHSNHRKANGDAGSSETTKVVMQRPSVLEYPYLFIRSFTVFWTACVVFGPLMWTEIKWW